MKDRKQFLKRIASMVLAVLLVFPTVFNASSTKVKAAGEEKSYQVVLGDPSSTSLTEGSTFSFSNALVTNTTGNSDTITSMTVSVSKGSIQEQTLGTISDLADSQGKHMTSTWIWADSKAKTTAEVQEVLRGITFEYSEGMVVTVVIDGNKMSLPTGNLTITSYELADELHVAEIGGATHYYVFVPDTTQTNTWQYAYNTAKSSYFMGMRGYLVTITELGEDLVLDKITTVGAWAGGARLANTTAPADLDKEDASGYTEPSDTQNSRWYWVDGPEAGCEIPNEGSTDITRGVDSVSSNEIGSYSNWRRLPNDSSNQEPNNYNPSSNIPKCEWCLQVHYPNETGVAQQSANGGQLGWNDLSDEVIEEGYNSNAMKGFFIEFSAYPNGMVGYSNLKNVSVSKKVHNHSWQYNVDDSNNKITVNCGGEGCNESYEVSLVTNNYIYSGEEYSFEAGCGITDTVTGNVKGVTKKVEYVSVDDASYPKSTTPPTDVNAYRIIVSLVDESGNPIQYEGSEVSISGDMEIIRREITVTPNEQSKKVGQSIDSNINQITISSGELAEGEEITDVALVVAGTDTTNVTAMTQNQIAISSDSIVIKNTVGKNTTQNYDITTVNGTLNVPKKETVVYEKPNVGSITYGQTVNDSVITGGTVRDELGGNVEGTWTWKETDKDKIPTVIDDSGVTYYTLEFTPNDTDVFKPCSTTITIVINKRDLELTAPSGNTVKDQAPSGSFDYTGVTVTNNTSLASGDSVTAADLIFDYQIAGNQEVSIDPSSIVIMKGAYVATANYNITCKKGNLRVYPKAPVINDNQLPEVTVTYGDKLGDNSTIIQLITENGPIMDGSNEVTGHWEWDTSEQTDINDELPHVSDSVTTEYPVVFIPDSSDYSSVKKNIKITVLPKEIGVDWGTPDYTYDGQPHKPSPVAGSGVVGNDTVNIDVAVKQGGYNVSEPINAGDYTAEATCNNNDYKIADSDCTKDYTINKRELELTAPDGNTVKGSKPSETLDYTKIKVTSNTSLANGDILSTAEIAYSYQTAGNNDVTINPASIVIKNANDYNVTANYNITCKKGNLRVYPKAPVINDNQLPTVNVTYGDKLGDKVVIDQLITKNGPITDGTDEIKGHWEWDDVEEPGIGGKIPHVSDSGVTKYHVIFIPDDSVNYSPVKKEITVNVAPKEIEVNWDKDTFEYNGKNQRPDATIKEGSLVGNDKVNLTYTGEKKNVGEGYEAIVSSQNPDYVIKTSSSKKGFKIVPKGIVVDDDSVVTIDISYDKDDESVIITITDNSTSEILEENVDYKYIANCNPDDEYWEINIEFIGNYSGKAQRFVLNLKYRGVVNSIVEIDAESRKMEPKMETVSEENAIKLILIDIDSADVPKANKEAAKAIIEAIQNAPDHEIENGEYEATISLVVKDAEKTVPEADVAEVKRLLESADTFDGMNVGKYFDLSLYADYTIYAVDPNAPEGSNKTKLISIKNKITDTSDEAMGGKGMVETITLTIPEELRAPQGYKREYGIVRVHRDENGNAVTEELPVVQNDDNTITFSTNMFSTYALIYKETKINNAAPAPQKPNSVEAPKTGDTPDMIFAFGFVAIGLIALLAAFIVKKRVSRK